MESRLLITNIQRFSLHDGPGIRTTVFLKGCSLRCPWCSNPENLLMEPQPYVKDGIEGVYGKYYRPDELVHELLKDRNFYSGSLEPAQWRISSADQIKDLPGGVTFSGGEALLQMNRLEAVCSRLHEEGIHIAVETCLSVSPAQLESAIQQIDFFYADMKILDPAGCRSVVKGDLELYLKNLDRLLHSGKPVVIRIPVIGDYTDGVENRRAVKELIKKYRSRILKVELIREHNLGESKYRSLHMKIDYHGVSEQVLEDYKAELDELAIPVEICKI